jgi:sulfur carrier protein
MKVLVNGHERDVQAGATVAELVRELEPEPERGVAVALDGEVVPLGKWDATPLAEGQSLEVLHAVQGG